ncbi:DUF6879 family protein [Pseudonocardia zijingensis]|uniref:DUF6879 domain-containing protein n=1 Tax=Pseudonocardia zijingensis TaxID=153376 RepID=A0ABP4AB98_9PSEU
MTRLLRGEEFDAKFEQFRSSVFRLETLQVYRGSGEDDAIAAFTAGLAAPPADPVQDDWEAMIRAHVRAGRVMRRVHVVTEPVTDYMQFELTWAYAPNAAAGEDIRIVPVRGADWPAGLPRLDFWLFDDAELFVAHYAPDGTWLGVEPVDDPARVATARRWRDTALQLAMPWRDYIAEWPELAARIPAGIRG